MIYWKMSPYVVPFQSRGRDLLIGKNQLQRWAYMDSSFQSRGRDLLIGKKARRIIIGKKIQVSVPWSGFINRKGVAPGSSRRRLFVSVPWSGFINRKGGGLGEIFNQ